MAISGQGVPIPNPIHYPTLNPFDYPSAGTVRKVGTWTAIAGLPILLTVFSDTDVATVLRAERELNLSGRVAP